MSTCRMTRSCATGGFPRRPSGCLDELESGGIDAVAHSCRLRSVIEDVAEVGIAPAARQLGSLHDQAVVGPCLDVLPGDGLPEARPAGPGLELGVRREQVVAAADALVDPLLVVVPVPSREGSLRPLFAGDLELRGCELLAPFIVRLDDPVHSDESF